MIFFEPVIGRAREGGTRGARIPPRLEAGLPVRLPLPFLAPYAGIYISQIETSLRISSTAHSRIFYFPWAVPMAGEGGTVPSLDRAPPRAR